LESQERAYGRREKSMGSRKRDDTLYIDREALATLAMLKEGIFSPIDKLLNQKEAKEVDKTSRYKDSYFPFSFILAPSGKTNERVLKSAKRGDKLQILVDGELNGEIVVQEVFEIDKKERAKMIFSTIDKNHPGVVDILNRVGNYAISGDFKINYTKVKETKELIKRAKEEIDAKKTTAMMINAKPLHRAHERMIRSALEENDLVVLFLQKPYRKEKFDFELRLKALNYYITRYLPKNRVIVAPFENTYIFAGYHNIILDAIAAKNFGCNSLTIGENHSGIGIYYDKEGKSAFDDRFNELDFEIKVVSEYVYCNECRTLVGTHTCPHGGHHHIKYKAKFLQGLLELGLLPPAVLVRKEVSAIYLSSLFPNRFKELIENFSNFFPSNGLIEEIDDEKFYLEIMNLHQTVSLT
jgi:sulfate adenylyltransferase